MQVIDLSQNNSVLNNYIREIRDITIQADAMRFRRNMERIGEVIAIELSKSLKYKRIETQTPLAVAQVNILDEQLVIASERVWLFIMVYWQYSTVPKMHSSLLTGSI